MKADSAHEGVKLTCTACTFSHKCKKTFLAHYRLHRAELLECKVCHRMFASTQNRGRHVKRHNTIRRRLVKCDKCPFVSNNAHLYSAHEWRMHGIRMKESIDRFFKDQN